MKTPWNLQGDDSSDKKPYVEVTERGGLRVDVDELFKQKDVKEGMKKLQERIANKST